MPNALNVTASTDDGVIMGVRHKEAPIEGIQFHPESIATEYGHKILENFLSLYCKNLIKYYIINKNVT